GAAPVPLAGAKLSATGVANIPRHAGWDCFGSWHTENHGHAAGTGIAGEGPHSIPPRENRGRRSGACGRSGLRMLRRIGREALAFDSAAVTIHPPAVISTVLPSHA